MNWSKAKTILILFLLMTSILLSAMLYSSEINSNHIEPQTVSYAVNLLNEKGVSVSPELIPTELSSVPVFEAENVVSDYYEFARQVFPDCYQVSDVSFSSNNGTIEFNGDNFFISYSSGVDTDKKLKSPSEKAKAYLTTIGIDISGAEIDTSNDSQGLFTVNFTNVLEDKLFFDSKISVTLKGEKITSINGTWFTKTESLSSNAPLDSAPGLLVKFSAENKEFSNLEISHIELGYAVNEQGVFHKQSSILPVYQIITTDGRQFYIDARRR